MLDTVRLPGQVKDVTGLLNACDIGVLASHHEGFPNAILEYMAVGLPVIATDLPGNREVLGDDSKAALFTSGDADDLAMRLRELLAFKEKRAALATKNHHRAVQEFSAKAMCENTTNIIADLIKDSGQGMSR